VFTSPVPHRDRAAEGETIALSASGYVVCDGGVACYTALYIPADARNVSAATRLVPSGALLGQRP